MNALFGQVSAFILAANGVRRPVDFHGLSRLELLDPSMVPNPCVTCEGRGECMCGTGSNDPDAEEWPDECPDCCGSGNAQCPGCDNPAALLVRGDGRCEGCIAQAAIDAAEEQE